MDDADVAGLLRNARQGDDAAVRQLVSYCENEVRMVVRVRLPRVLRTQFDSMDFVQTVWQSVFAKDGPDLTKIENKQHLLGYLAGIARNKVYEEHRRRTRTTKYDVNRQEPLYVQKGDRQVPREVAASDPTPSQNAQAGDRLQQILEGRSIVEKNVVALRVKGFTFEEIGEALGIHESAVRRIVESIRKRRESGKWH